MRRIVLNPRTPPGELEEALRVNRTEYQAYVVYAALAVHPRAPMSVRESVLPQLFWRDLVKLIGSPHVPDRVRNGAYPLLRKRMERATFGEWKAFARMCPPRLYPWILKLNDETVFACLLDNPRMNTTALVRLIHSPDMSAALTRQISQHDRWNRIREIKLALVFASKTDLQAALQSLQGLLRQDLTEIASTPSLRSRIREAAAAMLSETRAPESPPPSQG